MVAGCRAHSGNDHVRVFWQVQRGERRPLVRQRLVAGHCAAPDVAVLRLRHFRWGACRV